MADAEAIRAKILEIVRNPRHPLADKFTINDLYARVARTFDGEVPVSRATFYTWFNGGAPPKQSIVECIPAFAKVLNVPEYELWQAAGVIPPEMQVAASLGAAAHDVRQAYRRMRQTMANNGLSTAGEALIVDRILHSRLDYRMTVWPVVRGRDEPLHLHSWIVLESIEPSESTRRLRTQRLEAGSRALRRAHLRDEVITEGLWKRLGLKWRNRLPEEFEHLGEGALFIEVPVEERNRSYNTESSPGTTVPRLLVLGAPWAHAELMAALLADALRFGSWDLRYIGFPTDEGSERKLEFARERLRRREPGHVWALAQRFDLMHQLHDDILAAAPGAPVVVVTYGSEMATFAAKSLRARRAADVEHALTEVRSLVEELREHTDVIHVDLADDDVLGAAEGDEHAVRDIAVDLTRRLTARVLTELRDRGLGPAPRYWGAPFDKLLVGGVLAPSDDLSTVTWLPSTAT